MTGPQPNPHQPYGQQNPAPPPFAPRMPRREGSMAPKVWGILLLILGGLGLMQLVMGIATIFGGGMKASTFSFNMSNEAKEQIDVLANTLADAAMHRWSFWANSSIEVIIVVLSCAAGFLLVIRPRAAGRKLAVARALLVLLALPVYGYESMQATIQSTEMMSQMQGIQIQDAIAQEEKKNPSKNDEERERRKKEITQLIEGTQPVVRMLSIAMVVVTIIGIIAINGTLLFNMTRPSVKDYMDHVAEDSAGDIPGFDASMGLAMRPQSAPPTDAAPQPPPNPPAAQPPAV